MPAWHKTLLKSDMVNIRAEVVWWLLCAGGV